jgi:hypothetical protein
MSDVKTSLLSRLTNLFPSDAVVASSLVDKKRGDDRSSVADAERRLFDREESFYWTWQYPGQW